VHCARADIHGAVLPSHPHHRRPGAPLVRGVVSRAVFSCAQCAAAVHQHLHHGCLLRDQDVYCWRYRLRQFVCL
jgi:hypothetical protein